VYAGSPAAEAGIEVGDRVTAVDSQPAAKLTLPALRLRLRTDAPGTRVRLTLRTGAAAEREVTLTLRDLV
jgi:C-terminal processing protease CtpA/Prc